MLGSSLDNPILSSSAPGTWQDFRRVSCLTQSGNVDRPPCGGVSRIQTFVSHCNVEDGFGYKISGASVPVSKQRRRDRFTNFLGLSSRNNPQSSPTSTTTNVQSSNSSRSSEILSNALQNLSEDDRATLQQFIVPNTDDVNIALEQCLTAAEEKK